MSDPVIIDVPTGDQLVILVRTDYDAMLARLAEYEAAEDAADIAAGDDLIAARAGAARADKYIERITNHCAKLADSPERGTRRDEQRPGLRTLGFERRATIAFHVETEKVVIDRILYGGRDLTGVFEI